MSETTLLPLPEQTHGTPEWVHVLPAGTFSALGGSKTYRAGNLPAIIERSLRGGKIVLDENHSTDLAAPRGKSSPAMGWIVALQPRPDGIWGRVDWTKRGKSAMEDRAYCAISPALKTRPDGTVLQILRAALTNNPDLLLTTLHSQQIEEDTMAYPLSALCSRLGLPSGSDETAINSALEGTLHAAKSHITLHAQMAALAGLDVTASDEAIFEQLKAQQEDITLHASSEQSLHEQITALKASNAKMAGERFIEQAGRKKVITNALKNQLMTLFITNAELAKNIVASLPEAPFAPVTTLHGAPTAQALTDAVTGAEAKSMKSVDEALGLTEADLKAGGLL